MPQSKNPFAAGFAAITIAILFGYYLPTFTLPKFDFNVLHGAVLLGHPVVRPAKDLVQSPESLTTFDLQLLGGFFSYALFAVLLAYLYAHVFYRWLPGYNIASNIVKGLLFGLILFVIYDALIFNRVFDTGPFFADVGDLYAAEEGSLMTTFGPPGETSAFQWALASLFFFVFYGMMLGLFYNPPPPEEQR